MILEAIITVFLFIPNMLLGVIPPLVQMPAEVSAGVLGLVSFIPTTFEIASYIYGSVFFSVFIALALGILVLENAWKLLLFIVKKIPFLSIR